MRIGFKVKDDWDLLFQRLDQLQNLPAQSRQVMRKAGQQFHDSLRQNLAQQGRGGAPPPLSGATRRIYDTDGEPDGSAILDHIVLEPFSETATQGVAIVGVAKGKPTMLMMIQNDGCVIPVSEKMRGFLAARYGIFLKHDTLVIVIPGRGVWENTWKQAVDDALRELHQLTQNLSR